MQFYPRLGLSNTGDRISIGETDMIWELQGTTTRIPWSEVRKVAKFEDGCILRRAGGDVFVPNDYVNFDDLVDEMREQARRANPGYQGKPERRTLMLPQDPDDQLTYASRAQRFHGTRFPSRAEFQAFLRANPGWTFNEASYYECAMSICTGAPVGEGYATDIDTDAPQWFRDFQARAGDRSWKGAALLELLQQL